MNRWKDIAKETFKDVDWVKTLLNVAEVVIYIAVCSAAYRVLVHFSIFREVHNIWLLCGAWAATFIIGDYLIARHEAYLFRRKIIKTAREVAKYKGIDPQKLDYKDIKISVDENGYMDIEIDIKEKTRRNREKKKRTK